MAFGLNRLNKSKRIKTRIPQLLDSANIIRNLQNQSKGAPGFLDRVREFKSPQAHHNFSFSFNGDRPDDSWAPAAEFLILDKGRARVSSCLSRGYLTV